MNCPFCGKELPVQRHPSKLYCNQACRQADYRRRHPVVTMGLRRQLENAKQRIAELEGLVTQYENRNSEGYVGENETCPHEEQEDTTMTRKRSESRPRGLKIDLPSGCILAHDFAKIHGVPWGTFRDHMVTGIGKGLPPEQKDRVACCERPKAGRNGETERYLTQEQQRAALDYWQRHGVNFTC